MKQSIQNDLTFEENSINYWTHHDVFNQYVDSNGGDRFAAILDVAASARSHMKEYKGYLQDSAILACVVKGSFPDISKLKVERHYRPKSYFDALDTVSDNEVLLDVKDSIFLSIESKHLIYVYKHVSNEHKKSRVRILCNMIWDVILKEYT